MRLFIYEYACAQPDTVEIPDSVRREGRAMFEAVLADARKLEPGVEVITELKTQDSALSTQDSLFALIIAPEFDGILEAKVRWALASGCRLLGPSPEAIRLTADKWELYQHWKRWGVPTPVTWLSGQKPRGSVRYVKKHRYGAGSLGVDWWSPGDVVTDVEIIQEYVPGLPVSVALLISVTGEVFPLLPARQHIGADFGYLGGSFLDDPEQIKRVTRLGLQAVEHIPGLQGYVGVDAILGEPADGSQDVILEINPRLTTSYLGLRKVCQGNLVQSMLDAANGTSKVPSWRPSRQGSWISYDKP